MGWKDFFKFSWRKIIITVLLVVVIGVYAVLFSKLFYTDTVLSLVDKIFVYLFFWPSVLLSSIFGLFVGRSTAATDIPFVILSILFNGFYFYVITSLIDYVVSKIRHSF